MNKAIFAKPDIEKLRKEGYYCVDMHCHSRYSDGLTTIEGIYKRCKKLGIGVAITDHNECKGALKIVKYKGLNAIPGIETTSKEGIHTLFYFYNTKELEEFHSKFIKNNLSVNPHSDLKISVIELVENAKKYSCKICSAHPFAVGNTGIHKFLKNREYRKAFKKIDFIEAINSSNFHNMNAKAVKWGQKTGKPFTAGSDAHASCFIGNAVTASKSGDFLDSLKKHSLVVGTEVNPVLLTFRHLLKFRMFARFPKFYIKKLIRENLKKK